MIREVLVYIAGLAVNCIRRAGYPGVFLLMVLESACLPVPSEVVCPFSGYLVYTGEFDFFVAVLAQVLGNLVGSLAAYYVGLLGGRELVLRYGRYILLREEHLRRAEAWFERYGDRAIFVSRLLPVVRTVISLPAGVARMNPVKFAVYTTVGSAPWCAALTYAGVVLGANWHLVGKLFERVDLVLLLAVLALLVFLAYRYGRRKRCTSWQQARQ